MKRMAYLLLILLFFLPHVSFADTSRLPSNYIVNYELPSDRWEVSADAPELAIQAMMVDMEHDQKKKGETVDMSKLRESAEKFIKVNNLFIYNQATEAYLMISLSPASSKGGIPTESSIRASVKWTVDSLKDHAEVGELSQYKTEVKSSNIPGVDYAMQVTSDLPLFGEPHRFIGVIGYAHPYWVFFFYNDKARDPRDMEEMALLIKSIKLTPP